MTHSIQLEFHTQLRASDHESNGTRVRSTTNRGTNKLCTDGDLQLQEQHPWLCTREATNVSGPIGVGEIHASTPNDETCPEKSAAHGSQPSQPLLVSEVNTAQELLTPRISTTSVASGALPGALQHCRSLSCTPCKPRRRVVALQRATSRKRREHL